MIMILLMKNPYHDHDHPGSSYPHCADTNNPNRLFLTSWSLGRGLIHRLVQQAPPAIDSNTSVIVELVEAAAPAVVVPTNGSASGAGVQGRMVFVAEASTVRVVYTPSGCRFSCTVCSPVVASH
jgi:hypothetical protein